MQVDSKLNKQETHPHKINHTKEGVCTVPKERMYVYVHIIERKFPSTPTPIFRWSGSWLKLGLRSAVYDTMQGFVVGSTCEILETAGPLAVDLAIQKSWQP